MGVQLGVVPKMLLRLHPQGQAQLRRQHMQGVEGYVEGPPCMGSPGTCVLGTGPGT